MSRAAPFLLGVALLLGGRGAALAGLDDRVTDQVRLSLSVPEFATASYEHHFHHGGFYFREPFAAVEAGYAGGKLSLGSGWLESPGTMKHCEGDALKLSVLRTWDNPVHAEAKQTYVGIEAERFFAFLGHAVVKVGVFYRVSGNKDKDPDDRELLITAGIGLPIFSHPRGPSWFE